MSTANCFRPACLGSSHTSAFISGHTEQVTLAKPVGNSQSHVCPAHSPCFSTIPSMWASLEINSFFLYFTQATCTGLSLSFWCLPRHMLIRIQSLFLSLKDAFLFSKLLSPAEPGTLAFSYPQLLPFIPAALPTLFIWNKLCFFLQHHVNTDAAPTWFIFFMPW